MKSDRALLGGSIVLFGVGLERLTSAALLAGRDMDVAVRLGIGAIAIVLGVVAGLRWTQARRSR